MRGPVGAGPGRRFGELKVKVVQAKDLREPPGGSAKDPFCLVQLGDSKNQTQTAVNGRTAPLFNEEFTFDITKESTDTPLVIEVYFKQLQGKHVLVGRAQIEWKQWIAKRTFEGDIDIMSDDSSVSGKVKIRATFDKAMLDAKKAQSVLSAASDQARDPAGQFTPQEIRDAFVAFDLDKNNFVGMVELRHILSNIGENASEEEVAEMIRMIDKDGDGQVAFEEFYELVSGGQPMPPGLWSGPGGGSKAAAAPKAGVARPGNNMQAKAKEREAKSRMLDDFAKKHNIRREHIKKSFKKFQEGDSDKSGTISYSEFCELLDCEPSSATQGLFSQFDKDKSGKVDLKEFMIGLSSFTSASKDERMQFAFAILDTDNSGSINMDELMKMLMANHFASSQEDVRRKALTIMQQADKDGNGVITLDEFKQVTKTFPNLVFPAFNLGKKVAAILS
jgi:serine/threonine-protein phosphatase 2B regulatory subunit